MRSAMADVEATAGFVVYAGEERYRLTETIEAIPLAEAPAAVVCGLSGLANPK